MKDVSLECAALNRCQITNYTGEYEYVLEVKLFHLRLTRFGWNGTELWSLMSCFYFKFIIPGCYERWELVNWCVLLGVQLIEDHEAIEFLLIEFDVDRSKKRLGVLLERHCREVFFRDSLLFICEWIELRRRGAYYREGGISNWALD